MTRYYYPKVIGCACFVCVDDEKELFSDYMDNWNENTRAKTLKGVWSHCERLAKRYARRHNLKAIYTAHPDRPQAVWAVV